MIRLHTLLGNHAHLTPLKSGAIRSSTVKIDFADEPLPHEAFKPFVRDLAFDCGELAIVTFLQAESFGKPLVLLPVVVSSRLHHGSICYDSSRGPLAPRDIEGQSVGVRTYAQTTGVWVRGVLQEEYGVDNDKVTWKTCDESHLAEYTDPPNTLRCGPGTEPDSLLRDGEVVAAIPTSLASKALYTPPYKTLISEPEQAADTWYRRRQIVPINHMFVARKSVLEAHPEAIRELLRMLNASKQQADLKHGAVDMVPFGIEENRRSLEHLIRLAHEQHLIPRRFEVDELFDDVKGLL